jgi:hypothetical protein
MQSTILNITKKAKRSIVNKFYRLGNQDLHENISPRCHLLLYGCTKYSGARLEACQGLSSSEILRSCGLQCPLAFNTRPFSPP